MFSLLIKLCLYSMIWFLYVRTMDLWIVNNPAKKLEAGDMYPIITIIS